MIPCTALQNTGERLGGELDPRQRGFVFLGLPAFAPPTTLRLVSPAKRASRSLFLRSRHVSERFSSSILWGGWHAQRHRDQMLESMRNQYSLTESQVAAIREIEDHYHGTGSIFFRPTHGPQEEAAHQLAISQQMSPESAAIFLATRNSKSGTISHRH